MDKAGKRSFGHLRSALGARDSRNRVSWLSAHLLDLPVHEAYRKELSYDPSSTLSLVRKWGPLTRNILRSMECVALGLTDKIGEEAKGAAKRICDHPSAVFEGSGTRMPQSEASSVVFLRRPLGGIVTSETGMALIPTPHLLAIFEEQRKRMSSKESFDL